MQRFNIDERMVQNTDIILEKVWLKSIFDLVQLSAFLVIREQYPGLVFICSDIRSNLIKAARIFVTEEYILIPEHSGM